MKAVVYHKKGSPDKLVYQEVSTPEPSDHEVLVKLQAISINAADYRSLKMDMIPKEKIFGSGIAGIIASVGTLTTQIQPGDSIIGDLADFGFVGLAEYAAVCSTRNLAQCSSRTRKRESGSLRRIFLNTVLNDNQLNMTNLLKNWKLVLMLCLTLGLAPFFPEPHIVGKIRWISGGANGMQMMDWLDVMLHGFPWALLFIIAMVKLIRTIQAKPEKDQA